MMEEFLQIPQMMEEFLHHGGIPPSDGGIPPIMEEFLWVISGHYDRGGLLNTPQYPSRFGKRNSSNQSNSFGMDYLTKVVSRYFSVYT
jgi:hypothetical protein